VEYQYYATKSHPQGGPFVDHVGSASLRIPVKDDEPELESLELHYFTNHGERGSADLKRLHAVQHAGQQSASPSRG
jgi:hypothetical protein